MHIDSAEEKEIQEQLDKLKTRIDEELQTGKHQKQAKKSKLKKK